MMHKAWSGIVEVPYLFFKVIRQISRSHGSKNRRIWPKLGVSDCNSSLISPMAMKCCTKLETAKERCPNVFQGHPSNFKVTREKTSPILTQSGRFRTIGRSQLSNPSDLPCYYLDCTKCKFPDFSQYSFFPDLQQNSLSFPWLLPSLEFPWLFPDHWTPCKCSPSRLAVVFAQSIEARC